MQKGKIIIAFLTGILFYLFTSKNVFAQTWVNAGNPQVRSGLYAGMDHLSWTGSAPQSARIFFSPAANANVGVVVYTPPSYITQPNKRFPVIYFLHGINGNEWNYTDSLNILAGNGQYGFTSDNLITLNEACRQSPVNCLGEAIIVIPNGIQGSGYINNPYPIESMIINDLVPYIDTNYRTNPSRVGRALHGFSMGGMGAMYYGTKYPDKFSSVVAMSSACYILETCESIKSQIRNNITQNAIQLRQMNFLLAYTNNDASPQISNWQIEMFNSFLSADIPVEPLSVLGNAGHNMLTQYQFVENDGNTFGTNAFAFHMSGFNSPPLQGDVNKDGTVDFRDVFSILFQFGYNNPPTDSGDLNEDQKVNMLDASILIVNFLN